MGGSDYANSTQGERLCPRCGEGCLKAWYELSKEEREVVERLPASADYMLDARTTRRRWCTRCWHEEGSETPRLA
jgi:ribosomal protein S27AE